MLQQFKSYLKENQWFGKAERGLLALSGGLDSMVLAHLLLELELDFGIAHCNFKLRGEESDEDERFVRAFAKSHHIPVFSTSFDTETYAQEHKCSIQEAARDLRYRWLEELRKKESYDYLMTAHHLNDSMETVLYHLTKGTGIRGLHGIPLQNKAIIRPLSFASRVLIANYGTRQGIEFREDSSNKSTKYHRNLIRQEVIPTLKKINPSLEQTFDANIQRFKEIEWLYEYAIDALKKDLVTLDGDDWSIDLPRLADLPARKSILFEWLRPFRFHPDQIAQLFADGNSTSSGRIFRSTSHELLVNRNQLLLRPKTDQSEAAFTLSVDCEHLALPNGQISFQLFDQAPYTFPNDPNFAYLDFSQLTYPLVLRHWKSGDTFQPFGMNGQHQKLKDFFNHNKLSRFEKEQVWLLESAGQICWIVGHRLDERFRVREDSSRVLFCKWEWMK